MELNPVLKEIYDTGEVRDADGNAYKALPTSLLQAEGEALYESLRKLDARRVLEIGVAYGVSTLFICQALRDMGGGELIGLDPFQIEAYHDIGLLNVQRAGYEDLFTFRKDFSQDVLPDYLKAGDRFDLILIDGHHTFEQVMLDFYYSEKIVEVGGRIMFHDVCYPSVRKALAFILRNMNFELAMDDFLVEPSPLGHVYSFAKMAIANPLEPLTWRPLYQNWFQKNYCILRKVSDDTRRFDHYVPF